MSHTPSAAAGVQAIGAGRATVTCAEVLHNRPVAQEMFDLRLAVPEAWGPAVPGQFVSLTLERPWREEAPGQGGAALLRRPFSLAGSRVAAGRTELTILYSPVGKVTHRLCGVKPGESLDLLGPRGTAFPLPGDKHPVLVAGGRGIAPFCYVGETLRAAGRAFSLLYGVRTAAQAVGLGPLEEATVYATDDGSRGLSGTVLDLLDGLPATAATPIVMACGPHGMLAAVAAWAAARRIECWVSLEEVFGCGIGICAGCAIPSMTSSGGEYGRFLWACREGPVVPAGDVDWERWKALWQ
jgi:dihydroorotate dehydrogenase electron transfer subunit